MESEDRAGARVLAEVGAERRRQVEAEGWTPEHDDAHVNDELSFAAACYAAPQYLYVMVEQPGRKYQPSGVWLSAWPRSWDRRWFKPGDRRRNLVKAAALIVAEIERLDRASEASGHQSQTTVER